MGLRKKHLIVLLSTVMLGACATSKEVYTTDGTRGFSINCSGSMLNWDSCYERAVELCSASGYEVLEKIGEEELIKQSDHSTLNRGSIVHRRMIINCMQ